MSQADDPTKPAAAAASTSAPAPAPASASPKPPTQITVFSGFLGAGKTTTILQLIQQINQQYKVAWLKNEYGEVAVDSKLAAESNIDVKEMLNGCICCTQVGQMGDAIQELLDKYQPDRILLETSGSSLPAPLAWEIRRLRDSGMPIELDAIICVVDALNFEGYVDKSMTAKLQAKYTDLILINKHELVSEQALDRVLDDVYELNPDTPKIRTQKGWVDAKLLLGLDSKLLMQEEAQAGANGQTEDSKHQDTDVHVLDLRVPADKPLSWSSWQSLLSSLPRDSFYRVKGMLLLTEHQPTQISVAVDETNTPAVAAAAASATSSTPAQAQPCSCSHTASSSSSAATTSDSPSSSPSLPVHPHLLNYGFGRYDLYPLPSYTGGTHVSFMGDSSIHMHRATLVQQLDIDNSQLRSLHSH